MKKELQNKNPRSSIGTNPHRTPHSGDADQQQYYGGYYYYPHPYGQHGEGYAHHGNGDHPAHDHVDFGPMTVPPISQPLTEQYEPYYAGTPLHPATTQPSSQTIPKVAYATNNPSINVLSREVGYDMVPEGPYQERYSPDINQNYRPLYDDYDNPSLATERGKRELRNYYIPSKYRASSPTRRRSRRDDYEREIGRNEYDTSRNSSQYRGSYSSPERYRSSVKRGHHDNYRKGYDYDSPVRGHPTVVDAAHYPPGRPAVPTPPTYGSQEHYAAVHSVPPPAQYYQVYPHGNNTVPAQNFPVPYTGSAYNQPGTPPVLQRSQSVPMAAVHTGHDRYVPVVTE